jgi:hypothetical protein
MLSCIAWQPPEWSGFGSNLQGGSVIRSWEWNCTWGQIFALIPGSLFGGFLGFDELIKKFCLKITQSGNLITG